MTSKDVNDSEVPPLPSSDKHPWLESSTDLAEGLDVTEVTDDSGDLGLPAPAPAPPSGPADA